MSVCNCNLSMHLQENLEGAKSKNSLPKQPEEPGLLWKAAAPCYLSIRDRVLRLRGHLSNMQKRYQQRKNDWATLILLSGLGAIAPLSKALAQAPAPPQPELPTTIPHLRPQVTCPRDVEVLLSGLLRDLPGYANRVAHRNIPANKEPTGFGTILVAGHAEFEPIDVTTLTFDAGVASTETIQQVFFTTLEWQYQADDIVRLEQYHWLFLTEADDGWRLALMFSRVVNDDAAIRSPTPQRESSNGIIGQAVQLWLRDCRAGAVYPVASPTTSEEVTETGL